MFSKCFLDLIFSDCFYWETTATALPTADSEWKKLSPLRGIIGCKILRLVGKSKAHASSWGKNKQGGMEPKKWTFGTQKLGESCRCFGNFPRGVFSGVQPLVFRGGMFEVSTRCVRFVPQIHGDKCLNVGMQRLLSWAPSYKDSPSSFLTGWCHRDSHQATITLTTLPKFNMEPEN